MLNNLELLTSETQNQRSACNVLRNLHFLSFSPLANTESWERFFFWTDLLHPPASLHWQRGAEFDFKSTYGQQGHWKDWLGLKESFTSRKCPKTSDIALSFCREYLPARWWSYIYSPIFLVNQHRAQMRLLHLMDFRNISLLWNSKVRWNNI